MQLIQSFLLQPQSNQVTLFQQRYEQEKSLQKLSSPKGKKQKNYMCSGVSSSYTALKRFCFTNRLPISGFRGGGQKGGERPLLRISTPYRPNGSSLWTIRDILCWFKTFKPTFKKIPKVPSAPLYTNFEGERSPKKPQIFGQNFPKHA